MSENITLYLEKFCQMLESENLKCTKIRQSVLHIFFLNMHLNIDEILSKLENDFYIKTSQQTLYATLKLLLSYKIISKRKQNNNSFYELTRNSEHFHLLCENCKKYTDFKDQELLAHTRKLAQKNNFTSTNLNVVIYGICLKCQEKNS